MLCLRVQSVKKVEVQEALSPAGVIGAEPLTLVPQHFPRKPAQRCLRAITANSGFFDRLNPQTMLCLRVLMCSRSHGNAPEQKSDLSGSES